MKSLEKVAPYVYERGKIFDGRYTKWVPFLSKMVYKRVRVLNSGRNFVGYPPLGWNLDRLIRPPTGHKNEIGLTGLIKR